MINFKQQFSLMLAGIFCLASGLVLSAQPLTEGDLVETESRLAERFQRLELLAGRLAELSRSTQPRRARLLRDLIAKSREKDVAGYFQQVITHLEKDSLGKALNSQQHLQGDLEELLELLLQEDRDRQIESERKRIEKYLKELKQLIRLQRGIKARTESGDKTERTASDQQQAADKVGQLQQKIERTEGNQNNAKENSDGVSKADQQTDSPKESSDSNEKSGSDPEKNSSENNTNKNSNNGKPGDKNTPKPADEQSQQGNSSGEAQDSSSQGAGEQQSSAQNSESSPQNKSPSQRAAERLKQAQQRMQQAKENLEKAKQENALEDQEQALRELEQAKAELERILRQLREEELERTLVLLEARIKKMLDDQTMVYEETIKLDNSIGKLPQHELEISAGRLRRREESIVQDADRALILLREDGTSVAFPEALEQAQEDMISVVKRIGGLKLGMLTQGIEEDIIMALEETLAALQQALKELREQKSNPPSPQAGGSPGEQPLVDQLAELRMIRALQNRINKRTERYGNLLGDGYALKEDLREALAELAERQLRVFEATRDLETGRNR